jgi:Ca-activated chloride channel homolog
MNLPTPRIDLQPERGALPAGGGRIRALVSVAVDFPAAERDRKPLALALVVDRSGSMGGEPLEHAKAAAAAAVRALRDGDRVAVVAYDDRVDLVVPSTAVAADRGAILRAIDAVRVGNTTALHAGWVEGCTQVLTAPVASRLGRVVLLSDGLANVGITDPGAIAEDVARAVADGVTTSTIGLGRQFDERMMRHLADAGRGSYTFVESPAQLTELFALELAGMSALRGRELRLALVGRGVRIVAALGGARVEGGELLLPDLVAGLPRELLVTLEVDPGAELSGLRLSWRDLYTQRLEALSVDVDIATLPDRIVAAAPPAPAVAEALRVADLAERVAEVERLAREARLPEAARALEGMRREVAAWPASAARDEQIGDVDHLLHTVRKGDLAMAQKSTHAATYQRQQGVRPEALRSLGERERAWTADHRVVKGGSAPAASDFSVARADGGPARLVVLVGDLTDQDVDAIVNPTNRGLFGTAGVDGAVHRRGGPELTAACREIGGIKYGQAVVTPGFRLAAGRVIHTTTRPWKGGAFGELETLEAAYAASLDVARRLRLRTLALPAIGTGDYGYPLEAATEVAVATTLQALRQESDLEEVRFVLFEPQLAETYRRVLVRALGTA